jgi:hypothetical protein
LRRLRTAQYGFKLAVHLVKNTMPQASVRASRVGEIVTTMSREGKSRIAAAALLVAKVSCCFVALLRAASHGTVEFSDNAAIIFRSDRAMSKLSCQTLSSTLTQISTKRHNLLVTVHRQEQVGKRQKPKLPNNTTHRLKNLLLGCKRRS